MAFLDTTKIISGKIKAGRSSFLLVDDTSMERTADHLCDLIDEAGLNPVRVTSRDVNTALDLAPIETLPSVIVLLLYSPPNARTALFCKHIADDVTIKSRVGLRFPGGQVAEHRLMIHCGWVVTTPSVLREWGRGFHEVAEYYSVIEVK